MNTEKSRRGRGSALGTAPGLVRTHWWLIALATLVCVGVAGLVAVTRPSSYAATAEVVVSPEDTGSTPLRPDMGTERAIARSGLVAARASEALGIATQQATEAVTVTVVVESSVLRISFAATTPDGAVRGAGAFADAYIDYRNSLADEDVATQVTPAGLDAGTRYALALALVLGLLGGLSLGVAAAWTWDRLSDRLRHPEELSRRTRMPVLMRVPGFDHSRQAVPSWGPARDAFAYLAAKIASLTEHAPGRRVVVTSPRAGAGTTTVACGAAAALAAQGTPVVLVAAHGHGLLPEQVHGCRPAPGLRQLMDGRCSVDQALHQTSVRNLSVVPTGGALAEEVELPALRRALDRLAARGTLVLDVPPLLDSAKSVLFAELADLLLVVGDLRSGTRTDAIDAVATIEGLSTTNAGWVANLPSRPGRLPTLPPVSAAVGPSVCKGATTELPREPLASRPDGPAAPDRATPPRSRGAAPANGVDQGRSPGRRRPGKKAPAAPKKG
nr:hypothetical protein [Nocardioides agariphilus]